MDMIIHGIVKLDLHPPLLISLTARSRHLGPFQISTIAYPRATQVTKRRADHRDKNAIGPISRSRPAFRADSKRSSSRLNVSSGEAAVPREAQSAHDGCHLRKNPMAVSIILEKRASRLTPQLAPLPHQYGDQYGHQTKHDANNAEHELIEVAALHCAGIVLESGRREPSVTCRGRAAKCNAILLVAGP